MSQKHTAATAHGEIEYETVNCANCQNKVRKEDAIGVAVDVDFKIDWLGEVNMNNAKTANLCPYCADSLFNTSKSRYGGLLTNPFKILVNRIVQTSDPFFMIAFAFLGTLAALLTFTVIMAVLGALV